MSFKLELLPDGWAVGTIPDLISDGVFTDGDWVETKDQDPSGNIRLLQLADIGDGYFINKSSRYMNLQTAKYLNCTFLSEKDVLIARMPDPLGRACLMPALNYQAVTVVDVCVVRGNKEHFSPHWLMYFINSPDFRNAIASLQSGSTRKRISRGNLSKIKLPIPPRNEQTRIVEKLEELFSDLDDGVLELKAAQIKLSQYRQSLLKSAVEGSLTAEWREQNKVQETGEQLLEQLLKERREHWEKEKLSEFEAKGKSPPNDWQKKYPEPVQPDSTDLPDLPEGWTWATLSQIGWLDRGRSKHRPRNAEHLYGGKFPFIQTGDIREADTYITSSSRTYSEAGLAQSRLWPKGTMCITIAANIGETAILGIDACFPDSVVGFIPALPEMQVEFVELVFRTLKQKLEEEAPATAQKNINLAVLSKVVIPLPPLSEQDFIVKQLSTAFTAINIQDHETKKGLVRAEAQRKNILKEAFSGQLVLQNPKDAPASVLLEKIKADRVELDKKTNPKRTKKITSIKVNAMETIEEVLKSRTDWMDAQEAFRECGVTDGTDTDRIEELYAELRKLDKDGRLDVERHGDYDVLKLKVE